MSNSAEKKRFEPRTSGGISKTLSVPLTPLQLQVLGKLPLKPVGFNK